jgi:sorbitol-specific phosphotransferase system component IIC
LSEKYFVRFKGRVLGPLTAAKTAELVKRGQISRMHELSPDRQTWLKAEEFPEFFPAKSGSTSSISADDSNASTTAEASWYAQINDESKGPGSETQLRAWVAQGIVTADSLIWTTGLDEWGAASDLRPDLFATASVQEMTASTSSTSQRDERHGHASDSLLIELVQGKFWVFYVAVVAIVFGCVALLVSTYQFFDGVAESRISNAARSRAISSLLSLVLNGLFLWCAITFLRFGNSLTRLKFDASESSVVQVVQRLNGLWRALGIFTSVFLTVVVLFAFMTIVLKTPLF